jgi:large subunit ribosomal protein L29
MKAFEVRELSDIELNKRISDEKESLENLKFQQATKQIENTSQIKNIRRDIARMQTILAERKRQAAPTEKS